MSKQMLINASGFGETRVAVMDHGELEDLSLELSGSNQMKGNIYTSSVVHVDKGLEAAFIEYGAERHGFIPLHEIPSIYLPEPDKSGGSKSARRRLRKGTKILVQVERDPIGNKCASFTGFISLPGRYLVLMPCSSGGGISRKIVDAQERQRLKNLIKEFGVPDNVGLIIRTAGLSANLEELKKDYDHLLQKWETIHDAYSASKKPGLINADLNLVIRSVRDYFTSDIQEVWIDDKEVYESVLSFFKQNIPGSKSLLKLYREKTPLFVKFGIEDKVEKIFSRVVPLPSGGNIAIDPTEALIAIDVNSGSGRGSNGQEKLSFEINKAAALEVARQLKLRDLGGLVVVDFIDMKSAKNRAQIKKILQQEMSKDKARIDLGSISKFGLLELSRQRVKISPYLSHTSPCPVCENSGRVKSVEFVAMGIMRKVSALASRAVPGSSIKGVGAKAVMEFLTNQKRGELRRIETDYDVSVYLSAEPGIAPGKENLALVSGRAQKETGGQEVMPSMKRARGNKNAPGPEGDTKRPPVGKGRPRTRKRNTRPAGKREVTPLKDASS